jgi:hypothetical protein
MSIQDDIFDVQDALKDKPEAEAFERIYDHIGKVETRLLKAETTLDTIQDGAAALLSLAKSS